MVTSTADYISQKGTEATQYLNKINNEFSYVSQIIQQPKYFTGMPGNKLFGGNYLLNTSNQIYRLLYSAFNVVHSLNKEYIKNKIWVTTI